MRLTEVTLRSLGDRARKYHSEGNIFRHQREEPPVRVVKSGILFLKTVNFTVAESQYMMDVRTFFNFYFSYYWNFFIEN